MLNVNHFVILVGKQQNLLIQLQALVVSFITLTNVNLKLLDSWQRMALLMGCVRKV